eukprot:g15719.t1
MADGKHSRSTQGKPSLPQSTDISRRFGLPFRNDGQPSELETLEVLYEISNLLKTGLDRETLMLLVALCQSGVNPQGLVHVVKELRES